MPDADVDVVLQPIAIIDVEVPELAATSARASAARGAPPHISS